MTDPGLGLEVIVLADPDELIVLEVGRPELEGATVIAVDDVGVGDGGGSAGGRSSHVHSQDVPSEVWLILHGLPFDPSGIEVRDDLPGGDGHALYPQRITRPAIGRVRLDFTRPVRGTARLS